MSPTYPAKAAISATINKTTIQNVPTLLAVLMAVAVRQYYCAHHPMEDGGGS
jgi:hypothetical protein